MADENCRSRRKRISTLLACLACSLLHAAPALGQNTLEGQQAASARLTAEAAERYAAEDYNGAKALLKRARDAYPNPIVDYNLGRVHEKLGEDDDAGRAYERYLVAMPNAANADMVRARLAELRARKAAPAAAVVRDTPDDRAASANDAKGSAAPGGVSIPGVIVAAIGAVAVGIGTALVLDASSTADQAGDAASQQAAVQQVEDARRQETIGNVVWIAGGVVLAAGLTWLVVSLMGGATDEDASVALSPAGLRVRF